MHATPISAGLFLLASGVSAYLLSSHIGLPEHKVIRVLAVLVFWEAIQIFAVQMLAALQILGWVARVTVPALAGIQVAIVTGIGVWALTRTTSLAAGAQVQSSDHNGLPAYLLVATAVLAVCYLPFAVSVFTGFPAGSDAVIYHLPLALRWLQDGSLAIPQSHTWRYSMPGNAEIGMMILLSTGKQSASVMASWIPAAMVALSIYLLAMAISKRSRLASITACLIVFSIPMMVWQIFSAYADLLATAGILAAFALILGANDGGQKANTAGVSPALCFISALACGISLGTKPIYYFYAIMFFVFIIWVLGVNRKRGTKVLVKLALSAVLGMLLPSSFWFARAWTQTGSPVYPMQVRIGQRIIFAGYQPSQLGNYADFETTFVRQKREWLVYPWMEWRRDPGYLKIPYGEGEGVGAVFATFIPLGVMFFFLRAWMPEPERRRNWALLFSFAALLICWWGLMARVPRYGQPILMFACVLSVPLIMMLQIRRRRAFATLLVSSMVATSVVSASVPLHVLVGRFRKHLWSRSQIYSYPKLIDDLPDGSFVLNASNIQEKNFPLAGNRLTNRVISDFEAPATLTPQTLGASGADYVVEVVPGGKYSEASLAGSGAAVMDDEVVPSGNNQIRWRVWRVGRRQTSTLPHPSKSANGGAVPQ